jgi:hypothetical protein
MRGSKSIEREASISENFIKRMDRELHDYGAYSINSRVSYLFPHRNGPEF